MAGHREVTSRECRPRCYRDFVTKFDGFASARGSEHDQPPERSDERRLGRTDRAIETGSLSAAFVRLAWRPALLLVALVGAGLVLRDTLGDGATETINELIGRRDAAAVAGFVLMGALLSAVGVPRQIVAYAGGLGFGLAGGMALAMAGQILACVIDFVWARLLARAWVRRRMRSRLARFDRFLTANTFTATLMLRLSPVGNNTALNLLAGVWGVAPGPFLAGSAIGYLPQTLVFVLAGTGTQVGGRLQIALAVALFAASVLAGFVLWRRQRGAFNEGSENVAYAAIPRV
jgi:uncharacterized membrane protein YdjX (TVP38/TMEM64 family)